MCALLVSGALALNDVVCFKLHMNSKGLREAQMTCCGDPALLPSMQRPQASAPFWKRVGASPGGLGILHWLGCVASMNVIVKALKAARASLALESFRAW